MVLIGRSHCLGLLLLLILRGEHEVLLLILRGSHLHHLVKLLHLMLILRSHLMLLWIKRRRCQHLLLVDRRAHVLLIKRGWACLILLLIVRWRGHLILLLIYLLILAIRLFLLERFSLVMLNLRLCLVGEILLNYMRRRQPVIHL